MSSSRPQDREAILRSNAYEQQDYTPGSDVEGGEVVKLDDNRVGVVVATVEANEKGAVYTEGIFDILKNASFEPSAGDYAFWNIAEDELNTEAGADANDPRAGTVIEDEPTDFGTSIGSTRCRIRLNGVQGVEGAGAESSSSA